MKCILEGKEEWRIPMNMVSQPNMLINWDFRNPVNRNGQTEYITMSNRCTIDGWKSRDSNGIVTLTDDGLKLSGIRALIYQVYQRPTIGTMLTYSVLVKGPVTIGFLGTTESISNTEDNDDNFKLLTVTIAVNETFNDTTRGLPMFLNNSGANVTGQPTEEDCWIKAAKLELGSNQTLARKNSSGEWEIIDPPNYDLQYALCEQYSPITGKFIGSQHSNENLLDNWYFPTTINQRGETEYTATKQSYFIDRWSFHTKGGSYNVATRTLTMNENTYSGMYQRLELPKKFEGKTLTMSLLYSADIDTFLQLVVIKNDKRTLVAEAKVPAHENPECISITGIIPNDIVALDFQLFNKTGSIGVAGMATLEAAKLELGPVQTLAHKEGDTWILNDPPPNYQQELAKCQRYQILTSTKTTYGIRGVKAFIFDNVYKIGVFFPLPSTLRAKPSLVGSIHYLENGKPDSEIKEFTSPVQLSYNENGIYVYLDDKTKTEDFSKVELYFFKTGEGFDANL